MGEILGMKNLKLKQELINRTLIIKAIGILLDELRRRPNGEEHVKEALKRVSEKVPEIRTEAECYDDLVKMNDWLQTLPRKEKD
jgi:hypothetical protein